MKKPQHKILRSKNSEHTPNFWVGIASKLEQEFYGQIFYLGNEDFYFFGDEKQLEDLLHFLNRTKQYLKKKNK